MTEKILHGSEAAQLALVAMNTFSALAKPETHAVLEIYQNGNVFSYQMIISSICRVTNLCIVLKNPEMVMLSLYCPDRLELDPGCTVRGD